MSDLRHSTTASGWLAGMPDHRLLWLCPLVGLTAGALILGFFGVKLWTAITVALLFTCPLVIVWALLIGRRQQPFTSQHHV